MIRSSFVLSFVSDMFDMKKFLSVTAATASLCAAYAVASTTPAVDLLTGQTFSLVSRVNAAPITYNPPNLGAPRRTTGTGSRGCNAASLSDVTLSLAAPNDHIGLTVDSTPTFYWTVEGEVSAPIEFTLVQDGNPSPVFVKRFDASEVKAGMMSVTLPADHELSTNETYRWTVAVVCNANRRSSDVFAQSWVQRISIPNSSMGAVTAEHYGQAGLWYDALAALSSDRDREDMMAIFSIPEAQATPITR